MSRIGTKKIEYTGVEVLVEKDIILVKKGTLENRVPLFAGLEIEKDGNFLIVKDSTKGENAALHGTLNRLLNNAVSGLQKPFEKRMQLLGVGYRVSLEPTGDLNFKIGYSHSIIFKVDNLVNVKVINPTTLLFTSAFKDALGQVCAEIERLRKWNKYSGKGIVDMEKFSAGFYPRKAAKKR